MQVQLSATSALHGACDDHVQPSATSAPRLERASLLISPGSLQASMYKLDTGTRVARRVGLVMVGWSS
jgi:hypothetical protein